MKQLITKWFPVLVMTLIFVYCSFYFDKLQYVHDYNLENFQGKNCYNSKNICSNFQECCLKSGKPEQCRNPNLLACLKYKIKCENKCQNKKIDDNEKNEPNLQKCLQTCQQVEQDCCHRLEKH